MSKPYKNLVDHQDRDLILSKVPEMAEQMTKALAAKGWNPNSAKFFSDALNILLNEGEYLGIKSVVLDGGLVLFYSVGPCWWLANKSLEEEVVFRYKPGDSRVAFKAIETLAKDEGADMVLIGTAAANETHYGRHLERMGYSVVQTTYGKEIHNGTTT